MENVVNTDAAAPAPGTDVASAEAAEKPKRGRKAKAEVITEVPAEATGKAVEEPTTVEEESESSGKEDVKTEVTTVAEMTPETAPVPPETTSEAAEATDSMAAPVSFENMTLEDARKVFIPFGQKKGQFMGEVYATAPNAVVWYAEKYTGDNEEVRKAAQVILASAKK